jgi:hypothetical protein
MAKNKTGVTYENIKYYVSEDNRVTACVLECFIDYKYVQPMYGLSMENRSRFLKVLDDLNISMDACGLYFQTRGISKVNNGDTYNKVFGERLALSKAQQLAFSKANRMYWHLTNLVANEIEKLDLYVSGTYNVTDHCENHVEELIELSN